MAHSTYSFILPIFRVFLKRDGLKLLLFAFVLVLGSFLTAFSPLLFSRALDAMIDTNAVSPVIWAFVFYCLVYGAGRAVAGATAYIAAIYAERLKFVVSTSFFKRLLRKDISFLARFNGAEIQGAQNSGQMGFNIMFQILATVFIPGAIEVIVSLSVMWSLIDEKLTLIVGLYGALVIALTHFANASSESSLGRAIETNQKNAQFVGNVVAALEPIKLFRGFAWAESQFNKNADDVQKAWAAFGLRRITFLMVASFGLAIQLIVNFTLLVPQYQSGVLTIGEIVLFNALLLQLNVPFELIGQSMEQFLRAKNDLKPFADIWSYAEES